MCFANLNMRSWPPLPMFLVDTGLRILSTSGFTTYATTCSLSQPLNTGCLFIFVATTCDRRMVRPIFRMPLRGCLVSFSTLFCSKVEAHSYTDIWGVRGVFVFNIAWRMHIWPKGERDATEFGCSCSRASFYICLQYKASTSCVATQGLSPSFQHHLSGTVQVATFQAKWMHLTYESWSRGEDRILYCRGMPGHARVQYRQVWKPFAQSVKCGRTSSSRSDAFLKWSLGRV